MRWVSIFIFTLLLSQLSFSAIIRVPQDEPTIQAAIEAANYLDDIHVAPGAYNENLDFLGKYIKVIGVGGAAMTTLRGLDPAQPAVLFGNGEPPGTRISDFTITGTYDYHAIWICGDAYPTISHCIFNNFNSGRGVEVVIRVSSNARIKNNLFYNNGGISCIGLGEEGAASIINNTFDNNNRGFHCLNGNVIARNNIVTNSAEYGIYGSFADLSYNCVWNNHPNYSGGASPGTGSISTDPLYLDAVDIKYRLSFNSPCIDAGRPDPYYNDPDGSRNDMGAYPLDMDLPAVLNINYGSDNDDHSVSTPTPDIYWNYYDTAATSQVQYELEVGTDNEWTIAEMWATGQVLSADTDVTYAGALLEDRTIYFLRIRLFNGSSWGDWSYDYFYPHLDYIINVPGDYVRIQEAIDNSLDDDTILVAPGTYSENLIYASKKVKVMTTGGALVTTLLPKDSLQPTVRFGGGEAEGTEFRGFTLTGGEGENLIISRNGAYPTISQCVFHDYNPAKDASVVIRVESNAIIRYNLFYDNGGTSCIGVVEEGTASIINNTFDNNNRGFHCLSGEAIAKNNIVTNSADYGIYGPFAGLTYNCVWNNNPDYRYTSPGIGSISVDPMYLMPDNHDYGLNEFSPCINTGDPDPLYNDADGSPSDMGALPHVYQLPIPLSINYGPDAVGQIVFDSSFEIYWSYHDTTALPQTQFELEVGTNNSWALAEVWATGPVTSPDTQVTYAGPPLEPHQTYYIRLRLSNVSGWGSWRYSQFTTHLSPIIHVPADYAKIQDAIDDALGGDTILVSPGVYYENITLDENPVLVISLTGPEATYIYAEDPGKAVVRFTAGATRNSILSGFTLTGSNISGINCQESSPTILDNIITRNTSNNPDISPGIHLDNTHGSMIRGNIIYQNAAFTYCPGIYLINCEDDTICNNILYENSGHGEIRGLSSTAAIFNNTISVTTSQGIVCLENGTFDVRNNIITFAKGEAIYAGSDANVIAEYNCLYDNDDDFNFSPGEGNIYLDPAFVDTITDDYSLAYNSPCIDAGDPDPIYRDPDGTRCDMGAISYHKNLPIASNINFKPEFFDNMVSSLTPVIYWNYYDTAGTIQAQYELEIGTDNDWTAAEMWATGAVASPDTQVTYSGFLLTNHSTYYLRIRVSDGYSWGSWTYGYFTVLLPYYINVPGDYEKIQTAIEAASDGAIVLVGPGEYSENLDFLGKRIRVIGAEGASRTTLTPENRNLPAVRFSNGEGAGTEFSGFTVTGGGGYYVVFAENGANPTISNCIFHGNSDRELVVIKVHSDAVIKYNLFYNNQGISSVLVTEPGSAMVFNNTFNGKCRGIHSTFANVTARNNIVTNAGSYGIYGLFTELSYNCVWNNSTDYGGGAAAGVGDISADPLYFDTANHDYSLGVFSPCINTGHPAPVYNDPNGSRNDMGALPFDLDLPVALDVNCGPDAPDNVLSNPNVEIYWSYTDTAATTQNLYEIEVGTDEDWSVAEMWATGPVASPDTAATYAGAALADHRTYYIRIRVSDGSNWGSWRFGQFVTYISSIIHVPEDFPTIQEAINAPMDSATILVYPGTYTENLDFSGKEIKLIGVKGASQTILVSADESQPVVKFDGGEGSATELCGFTVTGGGDHDHTLVIGVNSFATISNCIFHDNAVESYVLRVIIRVITNAVVENCLFYNNGGISCIGIDETGTATILNNTFDNNHRGFYCLSGKVTAKNNIVTNSDEYGVAGYFADLSHNCIWNNNPDYAFGTGPGIGSISIDPLYTDMPNYDYRLTSLSPCIDAGDPDPQYNDPNGTRNDMGAFPYGYNPPYVQDISFGSDTIGDLVLIPTPQIFWSYFDTAASSQVEYEIEVGTDNDWSVAEMWSSGTVTSSDTQTTYAGAPLEDHRTHYIRIRVSNGSVWGGWYVDDFTTYFSDTIFVPGDVGGIQSAIDISVDGTTILVFPGVYTDNLDFFGKEIKVIGTGGAAQTTLLPASNAHPMVHINGGEGELTEFKGFTVSGSEVFEYALVVGNDAFATISDCIFSDNAWISGLDKVVIRVYSNAVIKNNIFYNNGGISCIGIGTSGSATIINNTFDRNHRGFHCLSGGVIAKNNIVTNSDEYGICGTFAELSHNCVWNNNPDYACNAQAGTGSISADPLYFDTSSNNYMLTFVSPCIDAGDPDPQYNDPDGSRNDMGAYPYRRPEHTLLDPDTIHVVDADAMEPYYISAYIGNLPDDYSVLDIDQLTLMINDSIVPAMIEIIASYPPFEGEVLQASFTAQEFIPGYGLLWDITPQFYTVSGLFNDQTPFNHYGEFVIIGHTAGDANRDGVVSVGDCVHLINFVFKDGAEPYPSALGDTNCDGRINVADAVRLVNYIFREGDEPCHP